MNFSKLEAIKFGLQKTEKTPTMVVGISLVTATYLIIPLYIVSYLLKVNEFLGMMVLLLLLSADFLIIMGYMKAVIDIANENPVSIKDLFFHYPKLPDFLIGLLFYLILILISSIFLIIPGIYLAIRFSFALFFILQGEGSALESLKRSWLITEGQFFNLLFLYIFLLLMNVAGFFLFFIGLGITLPISFLAIVYSYQQLSRIKNKKELRKVTADKS
jgi:uncharacterized membrane protein